MLINNRFNKFIATTSMIACLFSVTLVANSVQAQSDSRQEKLSDEERASIMFDLNLKKLRNHTLLKNMDINEMMQQNGVPENEDFDVMKLDRVFGGIQIPKDPSALQIQPGDDLKLNFFMRFEFQDSASAAEMLDSIKEKGSNTYEVDGKTYYGPDDNQMAPSNIRAHMVNKSTVEMATERYALLPNRNVVSTALAGFWKQVPKDSAIRLSLDLESNREVVDTLMEQAKAGAPSEAEPFLALIDDLSGLTLGLDFDADTLLFLRASGKDSEGTEKLMSGINGLLGMGKFFGQQGLAQSGMDGEAQGVFKELLKSLNAKTEGNTVKVDINKPEGFDGVIGKMMGQ